MKKLTVNSKTFWNLQSEDGFLLSVNKEYKALFNEVPVYIDNNVPEGELKYDSNN